MIESMPIDERTERISRLAIIPHELLIATLLRRGVPADSIDDTLLGLTEIGAPITIEDAVSYPFKPRTDQLLPFGEGRFSDGREYAVYYAALDDATCFAEIRYHLDLDLPKNLKFPRFYFLIESTFEGLTLDLVGQEVRYPDLVSPTKSGYPTCRAIAKEARNAGADALHTRSARAPQGICFPVFRLKSMRDHRKMRSVRVSAASGKAHAEWLED